MVDAPFGAGTTRTAQPVATAGNDLNTIVHAAPRAGNISAVTYTPLTTITGANTNSRTVNMVNLGQSGVGTTVVATLAFVSGVNATGGAAKTIVLSATPANLTVAAGDVLQWQSVHVGTGIADPGGLVSVTITTSYA